MNQSAQPGAQSSTPDPATAEAPDNPQRRVTTAAKSLAGVWSLAAAQFDLLNSNRTLVRPALLPLAAPPILCAIALLFAQGASIHWLIAILTLLASLLALAGIGALITGRRRGDAPAEWSPLRPAVATHAEDQRAEATARQTFATRLGVALFVLAALCALPIALAGAIPAALVGALGVAAVALYAVDAVRQRIAPLDEIIAPLCLGPGLVSLTIVAQGQRMTGNDWLVAAAIGCMALALIEGRRLRPTGAEAVGARRTLAALLGLRGALLLTGAALAAGFICALGLAIPASGLPGALASLIALPGALVGLSGLAIGQYAPARRVAANQLARAYLWFGLALAGGMALTVIAERIISALTLSLGA